MKKLSFFLVTIMESFLLLFSSCVSKPEFEGKGDLCGIIIDENNNPVKNCIVYCNSPDKKKIPVKPVLTNESGLFVFSGITSGDYFISTEKNNYLRIKALPYCFNDRNKIFCIQMKSCKAALKQVEEMLVLGQKKEASSLLDDICCEKNTKLHMYIKAYQLFTTDDKELKRSIISEIKKSSYSSDSFFEDYLSKQEELINEKS